MTDEQFGRAWAAQQGITPERTADGYVWYDRIEGSPPEANVPEILGELDTDWMSGPIGKPGWRYVSETEDTAYAALGAAVRAVHTAVPQLRPQDD